jgi:hypothetical protein
MLAAAVLAAYSLVLRYRRGDSVEQAQIRWIALFGSFVALAFIVAAPQLGWISDRAWEVAFAFLSCLPIAIGVAITRYRLYEIDRLINRTLVYGSLTAILAGIFTAGVGLAQRVFIATTGDKSDASIVLATLVVATAYAPIRKRLEAVVDRRFKYEHLEFGRTATRSSRSSVSWNRSAPRRSSSAKPSASCRPRAAPSLTRTTHRWRRQAPGQWLRWCACPSRDTARFAPSSWARASTGGSTIR